MPRRTYLSALKSGSKQKSGLDTIYSYERLLMMKPKQRNLTKWDPGEPLELGFIPSAPFFPFFFPATYLFLGHLDKRIRPFSPPAPPNGLVPAIPRRSNLLLREKTETPFAAVSPAPYRRPTPDSSPLVPSPLVPSFLFEAGYFTRARLLQTPPFLKL